MERLFIELQAMDWRDFAGLEEVQVESGDRMYYNDGVVQVFVEFSGYNYDGADIDIWEDEDILTELKELAVEALEEEKSWERL